MPPIPITPRQMEAYAKALQDARTELTPERFKELHAALIGTDGSGARWTVGLKTRHWNRLEDGRWAAADPPSELFLDSETVFALQALEASAAKTSATTTAASEGAAPPESAGARAYATAADAANAGDRARRTRDRALREAAAPRSATGAPPYASSAPDEDWSPVLLCVLLLAFFAALGALRNSSIAVGAAILFALLVVILSAMNLTGRRS